MFDISTVSKRYFSIKLTVEGDGGKEKGIELEVEPPKVKTLKKLVSVSKVAKEDSMDELAAAVQELLSKNKEGHKVQMEYIDNLDLDQLLQILLAYLGWVAKSKSDPN